MPQSLFLVAYDGTETQVVDAAIRFAKRQGAALFVVHVLEWSPYSFLTQEELAQRHKVRQAELAKAEEVVMRPLLAKIREEGVTAEGIVRHGNPADVIVALAKEKGAELILGGRSNRLSDRVFGGVASGLAQSSPIPVMIIP